MNSTDDVLVADPPHRSTCRHCCPAHDNLRAQLAQVESEALEMAQAADRHRAEVERLRAALLHIIDGVGGMDEIVWNNECPACLSARDLVAGHKRA